MFDGGHVTPKSVRTHDEKTKQKHEVQQGVGGQMLLFFFLHIRFFQVLGRCFLLLNYYVFQIWIPAIVIMG